jgi:hypothetical protein
MNKYLLIYQDWGIDGGTQYLAIQTDKTKAEIWKEFISNLAALPKKIQVGICHFHSTAKKFIYLDMANTIIYLN